MTVRPGMIVDALVALDRAATAPEILAQLLLLYPDELRGSAKPLNLVRAQLQHYWSESPIYQGPPDLFAKVKPKVWELQSRLPAAHSTHAVIEDVEAIIGDKNLSNTQRRALINARLGQGTFRKRVLARWGGKCAVTGCSVTQAIRASHIKPWRDCSYKERLDPRNGLPLIANLDALFDKYLITFDAIGELRISPSITEDQKSILGALGRLACHPDVETNKYLDSHRSLFDTLNVLT